MSQDARAILFEDFFAALSDFFRTLAMGKEALVKELGFNQGQFRLLMIMEHEQPMTVGRVAERLKITSSAATQLVDGLVDLKFLDRQEDTQDRRKVCIRISAYGQERLTTSKRIFFSRMGERFEGIENDELASMIAHFRRIQQAVEASYQSDNLSENI